ncbi:shikimate dehydrogenase, partial [Planctomycetota bacterium]
TAEQFKTLYRFDGINAETELYGVIGSPVAHSAGPAIHNACFAHNGMNKLYLPLLIEGGKNEFNKFMQNLISREWLGFRGFSVTIPHKRNALDYVKEKGGFVERLAEKIGAANTLLIDENGKPSAYNTDYAGALDAITSALGLERGGLKEWDVTVVGAGGVARAIVAGLTDIGARVKIYNRTVKKAERLAAEFDCEFAGLEDLPNIDAKLLINCTSVGMHPDVNASTIPKECLKKDMAVFDTIYNPPETLLLKSAKEVGAKTIDGLTMFINQAAEQFRLFTGIVANKGLMHQTICEKLKLK